MNVPRISEFKRDGSASRRDTRGSVVERLFVLCGAAFLVVAAIAAVTNVRAPFAHGWWLVAYLSLVGGVAQLLLGPGLSVIARRSGAQERALRYGVAELALWNVGTVMVAVADLMLMPGGVVVGSVLLIVALALFARDLMRINVASGTSLGVWRVMYSLLLVFMAVSTIVGTALAYHA